MKTESPVVFTREYKVKIWAEIQLKVWYISHEKEKNENAPCLFNLGCIIMKV